MQSNCFARYPVSPVGFCSADPLCHLIPSLRRTEAALANVVEIGGFRVSPALVRSFIINLSRRHIFTFPLAIAFLGFANRHNRSNKRKQKLEALFETRPGPNPDGTVP